jgi:hypothetical protein
MQSVNEDCERVEIVAGVEHPQLETSKPCWKLVDLCELTCVALPSSLLAASDRMDVNTAMVCNASG